MHSAGGQRDDPVPAHSFTLGSIKTKNYNSQYIKQNIQLFTIKNILFIIDNHFEKFIIIH